MAERSWSDPEAQLFIKFCRDGRAVCETLHRYENTPNMRSFYLGNIRAFCRAATFSGLAQLLAEAEKYRMLENQEIAKSVHDPALRTKLGISGMCNGNKVWYYNGLATQFEYLAQRMRVFCDQ